MAQDKVPAIIPCKEAWMANDGAIIKSNDVTKAFDDFVAVNGVNCAVKENETLGIIGPNGAGKTTFLNLLTGYYIPDSGSIFYQNQDITALPPEERVSRGIVRTFQIAHVFDNLTVYDHIALSLFPKQKKDHLIRKLLFSHLKKDKNIYERAEEVIDIFNLGNVAYDTVGDLALGSKRRLEVAMALAVDPVVLALDEPFSGLNESEIEDLLVVLVEHVHTKTVLIVEHKISKLEGFVDRLAVLHQGSIVADGKPEETLEDPRVQEVYWNIA